VLGLVYLAAAGLMADNNPEEMQKLVRYTDIIANALMLQDVADLTKALEILKQRGYPVEPEDVAHLSAYMTEHLQRFGDYTLKGRPVVSISNEEEVSQTRLAENDEHSEEELSA